jgi:hypothetical protein
MAVEVCFFILFYWYRLSKAGKDQKTEKTKDGGGRSQSRGRKYRTPKM